MKRLPTLLSSFGAFLAIVLIPNLVQAQCGVTATANPLTAPCNGGQVTLIASGSLNGGSGTVIANFNNGLDASVTASGGQYDNPCGAGLDATDHLWMGNTTIAPRDVTTIGLDLTCADSICFDLKFATQGNAAPCEGPDLANEGVYVQYSIDGGATFTAIHYFSPNGGNDPMLTVWNRYCFALPPAALTPSTIIQFYQGGASGTCCDHWGIDNITIKGCGGIGVGYYYDWTFTGISPDSASVVVNVNAPTTYDVIYTNGVDDTCSASVFVDLAMLTPTVNISDETCLGDADGGIAVTPIDGTGPFTYTWSHDSLLTGSNASGLPPGNYAVSISDSNGCGTSVYGLFVGSGANCCGVSINLTTYDSLCYSSCDGSFAAAPTGGAGGYTYTYTGPSSGTTSSAFNLCPGTYTLTVTDSSGCPSDTTFVIPDIIGASIDSLSIVDATCGCDGEFTAWVAGGALYSIDGGATFGVNNTFQNLCAGTINLMVQDSSGCSADTTFTVAAGATIPIINCPADTSICNGDSVTVSCSASGGTAPYGFFWSNGLGAGNNFTISPPSTTTYSVYAVDSLGCQSANCFFTVDVCCAMYFNLSVLDSTCNSACDGSFTAVALGGTGAVNYSYTGPTSGTTSSANNLCSGTYTVTATDSTGCTIDTSFFVGANTLAITCPPDTSICNGDSILVSASASGGAAPYGFYWSNGLGTGNDFTISPPNTTTYSVYAIDSLGCQSDSCFFTVDVCCGMYFNLSVLDSTCNSACDGSFTAVALGGTGAINYSYTGPSSGTTSSANNLCPGTYTLSATDSTGCNIDTTFTISGGGVSFSLACGSDTTICEGESATLWATASGGVAPYTYEWLGVGTGNPISVSPTTTTTYTVVATDSLGCQSDTCSVTITVNPAPPTPIITQNGIFLASSSAGGNQWYLNGQIIAGETNQAMEAGINGWYCVVVTDVNGCTAKSDSVLVSGVSIAEYADGGGFQLFPNPNDGEFSVSFMPTEKGDHTIEITNAIGQVVYRQVVPATNGKWTQDLQLSHLESGLYWCTIRRDGVAVAVRKLMKK